MKMSLKKLLSILLILIFSFTVLSACNDEKGNISNNEIEEEFEVIDLYGYEFKIKATQHATNTPEYAPNPADTQRGDKILSRYKEIEELYNCVIDIEVIKDDVSKNVMSYAMTGDKYGDLIDTYITYIIKNHSYYEDFKEFEEFDFSSDKWGYHNFLESTTVDGSIYGIFSQYWGLPAPAFMGSLFFLPRLFAEANVPNPHESYEKKDWNWEKFEEYCSLMTVTGEGGAIERYGTVFAGEMQLARAIILANGVEFVQKDSNDDYKYMINTPQVNEAVGWIRSLIEKDLAKYEPDSWQKAAQGMIDGIYAFHSATCYHAFYDGVAHFANECPDDTAWIPVPSGPSAKENISSTTFTAGFRAIGMPANGETDINAMLINRIFEPLEGENENSWKEDLKHQYFFDDTSFDIYLNLLTTTKYDFSAHLPTVAAKTLSSLNNVVSGRKTILEEFGSKIDIFQLEIDEHLNNK